MKSVGHKVSGILIVLAILLLPATLDAGWYSSSWNYRKTITIDSTKVAANLTDFPILINTTDTDLRDDAQEDGDDILFTSSDGTTKLSHEIEKFDGSRGNWWFGSKHPASRRAATPCSTCIMATARLQASRMPPVSGIRVTKASGISNKIHPEQLPRCWTARPSQTT